MLVVMGALLIASLQAAISDERELIGTWLGEVTDGGTVEGKTFDSRRWLAVIEPNRTGRYTMRFYLGGQSQIEYTADFEWALENDVWRVTCKSTGPGCEDARYNISISGDEIRYTNARGGDTYAMRKVPAVYQLP
jgi:hypothetical protein